MKLKGIDELSRQALEEFRVNGIINLSTIQNIMDCLGAGFKMEDHHNNPSAVLAILLLMNINK